MGCDIHTFALRKTGDKWFMVTRDKDLSDEYASGQFLDWRSYGMFAFLTNGVVRNYSEIPKTGRLKFEEDAYIGCMLLSACNADFFGGHTPRILLLSELLNFDYDQLIVDKRHKQEGEIIQTWRAFLGQAFFNDLEEMKRKGVTHFAFYFDN